MNEGDREAVVREMVDTWPGATKTWENPDGAIRRIKRLIREWDFDTTMKAVDQLAVSQRFWPPLVDLRDAYRNQGGYAGPDDGRNMSPEPEPEHHSLEWVLAQEAIRVKWMRELGVAEPRPIPTAAALYARGLRFEDGTEAENADRNAQAKIAADDVEGVR